MDIQEFLSSGQNHFLPNLSLDHVIMGYEDDQLKCLLLRIGGKWVLPGGFVKKEESVDHASLRVLKDRTNLENPHLKFLSHFGDGDRRFTGQYRELLHKLEIPWSDNYWINDRFVTLAYYSLVNIKKVNPKAGVGHDAIAWFDFDRLPDMWMDHRKILMYARKRLKEDINKDQISHHLLPEEFTMPELHRLHQTILEQDLDRSRFQKKMLSSGLFERLHRRQSVTPGSNPFQYRIKHS